MIPHPYRPPLLEQPEPFTVRATVDDWHRLAEAWALARPRVFPPETDKPFKVRIKWGIAPELGDTTLTDYAFATQAELDAFMQGIDEMDGWSGYTVLDGDEEADEAGSDDAETDD